MGAPRGRPKEEALRVDRGAGHRRGARGVGAVHEPPLRHSERPHVIAMKIGSQDSLRHSRESGSPGRPTPGFRPAPERRVGETAIFIPIRGLPKAMAIPNGPPHVIPSGRPMSFRAAPPPCHSERPPHVIASAPPCHSERPPMSFRAEPPMSFRAEPRNLPPPQLGKIP